VFVMAVVALLSGCGRTELETRPWQDPEAGHVPWLPDAGVDVPVDVPAEVDDVPVDGEPDADGAEAPPDADTYEFHGLSCMSAAMCAICCPPSDTGCQAGCVLSADPTARTALMAIISCAMSAGCGADIACMMEECRSAFDACSGGPGGTGGCLSLAWCLVSAGCGSLTECSEQATCYQGCFGAARPEAVGAARDLVVCIAGDCMADCMGGLTTTACLGCLASNCLPALRGCIGF